MEERLPRPRRRGPGPDSAFGSHGVGPFGGRPGDAEERFVGVAGNIPFFDVDFLDRVLMPAARRFEAGELAARPDRDRRAAAVGSIATE